MAHLLLAVIYLAFVSLGLPDGLLGAAWPKMYEPFGVPVSSAGLLAMIIAAGTIVSSLQCARLTAFAGTGRITAASVLLTAAALFGFSVSNSFPALCLWAVPYGLGAGCVDASLNNYVALHYTSRHMSWLHCMWGIGASAGPSIMGAALAAGHSWHTGYRYVAWIQITLTAVLFFTLPLWKTHSRKIPAAENASAESGQESVQEPGRKVLRLAEVVRIPGAKAVMTAFFCYCALEQTAGLWAASYLVLHLGMQTETAAAFASLFYTGITAGRALSGFLTLKFTDTAMIRLGQSTVLLGIVVLFLPLGEPGAVAGLLLIGLGCAPIYPSVIHSTPAHFGAERSQSVIGVQMASAYVGTCLMPPLFGVLAGRFGIFLFPFWLLAVLLCMAVAYGRVARRPAERGVRV